MHDDPSKLCDCNHIILIKTITFTIILIIKIKCKSIPFRNPLIHVKAWYFCQTEDDRSELQSLADVLQVSRLEM